MKRMLKAIAILLVVLLTASGCSLLGGEVTPTEAPTEAPTPSPTPTAKPYTPEPTVTPRTLAAEVEMPEDGATPMLIHPIDEPTRPPLVFNFVDYTSQQLGVKFSIPASWVASQIEGSSNALVFTEPDSEAHEGFASSVTIVVNTYSSAQDKNDASAELDSVIAQIKESYPQMTVSDKAENKLLGETGVYVTYRIKMPMGEGEAELMTRGRILIVPVNKKLYQVRYICPADYNSDYEKVFKEIRSTIEEL